MVKVLWVLYNDSDFRMITGIFAGVLLLKNFMFYRFFSVNVRRDKIIAFDNPSGRVSVSLMAMEDLVKRLIIRQSQVKDVKTRITASKKGLSLRIQLSIAFEVNIPELTAGLQEMIRRKIQDTIGIEDTVEISIYVGKILPERTKGKQLKKNEMIEEEKPNAHIPFQGYRA